MNLRFSDEDESFRQEIAAWLGRELSGDFAEVRGRGGPGDDSALIEERKAWERRLGEVGWIGLGWPEEVGGRGLSLTQQIIDEHGGSIRIVGHGGFDGGAAVTLCFPRAAA